MVDYITLIILVIVLVAVLLLAPNANRYLDILKEQRERRMKKEK